MKSVLERRECKTLDRAITGMALVGVFKIAAGMCSRGDGYRKSWVKISTCD